MSLEQIIATNNLDASLLSETREYPAPEARRAARLPWNTATQILATGERGTVAFDLAALSIAETIDGAWSGSNYAALDWVYEGDWSGNESYDAIQNEWDEVAQ